MARSKPGRAFWAALVIAALSMTIISISRAVDNYFSNPVHVVIENKQMKDMIYPPLKLCHTHWLHWVDFEAAQHMNFTKSEVLFAMSFLTDVFSEQLFDVKEVEESFYEKLQANNMSLIEEFYASIAYRKKIIQNVEGELPEVVVENCQADFSQPPNYTLCYIFTGDHIKFLLQKMIQQNENFRSPLDNLVVLVLPFETIATYEEWSWMNPIEIDLNLRTSYLYKSGFNCLCWIFPDAYSKGGIFVFSDTAKQITLSASVRNKKNSDSATCHKDYASITSNETCHTTCFDKFMKKNSNNNLQQKWTKKLDISAVNNVYFLLNSTWKRVRSDEEKKVQYGEWKGFVYNSERKRKYLNCIENCKQEVGCEMWTYSSVNSDLIHVRIDEWMMPTVLLVYPSNVAVMKEVNLQTWEAFISNVGGLLGIWTGASILTLLQIIYLCFYQGRVDAVQDEHELNQFDLPYVTR